MTHFAGKRILPVRPNWIRQVTSVWSYKTNIFSTREGNENRTAQTEKPRRRLEFTITETGDRAANLRGLLARDTNTTALLPDIVRAVAAGAVEGVEIELGAIPVWARSGRPIAVMRGDDVQVRKIVTAVDNRITLEEPVSFPTGAKIAPVLQGRVPTAKVSKPTSRTVQVLFDFEEDPATSMDPLDPLSAGDFVRYRGLPVFPFKPNWADGIDETYTKTLETFDTGFGSVHYANPEIDARWSSEFPCVAKNPAMVELAQRFFFSQKGQWRAFYCPTWTDDLRVVSVDSLRIMTVAGSAAYYQFKDSLTYRNVSAKTPDGVWLFGVKEVALLPNGDTRLTFDGELPSLASAPKYLSWLVLARFASDTLEMSWLTDGVATFTMPVISIFDRFFEFTIDGYRVMFSSDYMVISPYGPAKPTFVPITIGGEYLLVGDDYAGASDDV